MCKKMTNYGAVVPADLEDWDAPTLEDWGAPTLEDWGLPSSMVDSVETLTIHPEDWLRLIKGQEMFMDDYILREHAWEVFGLFFERVVNVGDRVSLASLFSGLAYDVLIQELNQAIKYFRSNFQREVILPMDQPKQLLAEYDETLRVLNSMKTETPLPFSDIAKNHLIKYRIETRFASYNPVLDRKQYDLITLQREMRLYMRLDADILRVDNQPNIIFEMTARQFFSMAYTTTHYQTVSLLYGDYRSRIPPDHFLLDSSKLEKLPEEKLIQKQQYFAREKEAIISSRIDSEFFPFSTYSNDQIEQIKRQSPIRLVFPLEIKNFYEADNKARDVKTCLSLVEYRILLHFYKLLVTNRLPYGSEARLDAEVAVYNIMNLNRGIEFIFSLESNYRIKNFVNESKDLLREKSSQLDLAIAKFCLVTGLRFSV